MVSKNERLSSTQWVLLRGLSREQRHWGSFLGHFKTQFGSSNVTTLDLPGFGTQSPITPQLSISKLVEQVRASYFKNHSLKPKDKPLFLVGLSLGGMIAYHWAATYPNEVKGTVLINTSFSDLGPFWMRFNPKLWLHLLSSLFTFSKTKKELIILNLTSQKANHEKIHIAQNWASFRSDYPPRIKFIIYQLISASLASSSTPSFFSPSTLLLICSQNDQMVSPLMTQRLANKLDLPFLTHSWGGHDLPLDDPEWLTHAIYAWHKSESKLN